MPGGHPTGAMSGTRLLNQRTEDVISVTIPEATRPDEPALRGPATSHGNPPPPGGGLGHGTGLPSGDPLSTRNPVEEGPWGAVRWGGGAFPSDLLSDSDLQR
jgi:hypothetical protein